jgi:hypothetical protein
MAKRQIRSDEPRLQDVRAHLIVVGAEEFRRAVERVRQELMLAPPRRRDELKHAA